MHLIYKQNLYRDKKQEIDDIFIENLVPIMDSIEDHTLTEEWKQNIDAAAHGKISN